MENQNTQTAQAQAAPAPTTGPNANNQEVVDGGLIVVMTESFGVTSSTDDNEQATETGQS